MEKCLRTPVFFADTMYRLTDTYTIMVLDISVDICWYNVTPTLRSYMTVMSVSRYTLACHRAAANIVDKAEAETAVT